MWTGWRMRMRQCFSGTFFTNAAGYILDMSFWNRNHKLLQICPEKIVHYGFWNNDTGKLLFYDTARQLF